MNKIISIPVIEINKLFNSKEDHISNTKIANFGLEYVKDQDFTQKSFILYKIIDDEKFSRISLEKNLNVRENF